MTGGGLGFRENYPLWMSLRNELLKMKASARLPGIFLNKNKILLFPSPTGYMWCSFGFSSFD